MSIDSSAWGQIDLSSGMLSGEFAGSAGERLGKALPQVSLKLEGRLEPLRAVHFTQRVRGAPVGGITLKLKP